MSDDTNKRPKIRLQTATERDMLSLERLRKERAESARARSQADVELSDAVVEKSEFDVNTGITTRIEEDPDLSMLFAKIEKAKAEFEKSRRSTSDLILEVAGEKPPAERFDKIERGLKFVHLVVILIAIPVITCTVMIARYVYARGGTDATMQLERVQEAHDLTDLKAQVGELTRELSQTRETASRTQQQLDDLFRHGGANLDSVHRRETTPP